MDKAREYLTKILDAKGKVSNWDKSIEQLVRELLAKIKGELLKFRCAAIWTEVKAALNKDKPDFDTARKLTSTAAPCPEEELRDGVLIYRIGVLNEIINPYQSDWIIYQMKAKVGELKKTGKQDEITAYLDSVGLIKDEIPSIEQKVREIQPSLENLYWLEDRIQSYLQQNIAQIQVLLDKRAVSGKYRDYKEVYDLVDAAVAEMKLYSPVVE